MIRDFCKCLWGWRTVRQHELFGRARGWKRNEWLLREALLAKFRMSAEERGWGHLAPFPGSFAKAAILCEQTEGNPGGYQMCIFSVSSGWEVEPKQNL